MKVDIGAPTTARDYPGLVLSDTDYFGNLRRARAFEWSRELKALDQPFDRDAWPLQPHNSNYTHVANANVMEVSAGALEPPFFDLSADPAVNYGAIGTLIGAQMAAAFDVGGRQFGPIGELASIFTPTEAARFDALRDSLSTRLSSIEIMPGVRLPGNLVADEVINDIIGIQIALDAYHGSLNGRPAPTLDGLTGDQRFFLGRTQMWRSAFVPAFLQWLASTGHNTPPPIRMNVTVQHVDAWYGAFDVQPGQRLYLRPDQRLHFLF
jgi:putative endopeptidase